MASRSSTQFQADTFVFQENNKNNTAAFAYKHQQTQQRYSYVNGLSNYPPTPPQSSTGPTTTSSEYYPQKRVFSSASNNSYNSSNRVSSSGSSRNSHHERISANDYFPKETTTARRTSTMLSNSSQPISNSHQRSSSYISVEELENKQPTHYKPYYAQQQHGIANANIQNQYNVSQQRNSYSQMVNSSSGSNLAMATAAAKSVDTNNYQPPLQNLSSRVSISASIPSRSSMRQRPTFGPYILGKTIGEGEFGKVKLAWSTTKKTKESLNYQLTNAGGSMNSTNDNNDSNNHNNRFDTEDMPKQVAIKLIKNSSIPTGSETETKLFREINSLRVLTHPNIVRLEEVIRNDTHIGIVLEYASGGEFYKYIQEKKRLKESEGCRLFAQLISGVQYMHSKGMAHRDLKLENLLLDRFENLIITDFGFVNEFQPGKNELMKTSCGSPCYAAPELVVSSRPYSARKSDLWSCGIILFAILAGYLPWDDDPNNPDGDDIAKLYMYITQTPLKFPEYITPVPRDLLRRILVPNPKHRLQMEQVYNHQWLQPHKPFLSISPDEWDRFLSTDNNKVYRSKQTQNSKQIRPRSSYSANGEKRNSLILENSYTARALPPKESHTFATIKTDQLPAAIAVQNMNYSNRKNRHESIDCSQFGNKYRYKQENVTSSASDFNFEPPMPIIDPSNIAMLSSSKNPSEISLSESPTDSLMSQKNNSSSSVHRRSNSAASIVLQQVIVESDLQQQQQQQQHHANNGGNKFQPSKPKRARPMSYQPGASNYFSSNSYEDKEKFEFRNIDQNYNRFNASASNIRNKKHSSTIHEEEGPEMFDYKLNKFNDQPLENENYNYNTVISNKGRHVSEASGSTIGTPTRNSSTHSKHYGSETMNETSQHTRVASQGTPINQTPSTTTNKKSKRFSLLSFYSLYDSSNSKSQVSSQSEVNLANTTTHTENSVGDSNKKITVERSRTPSKQSLQNRILSSEVTPKSNRSNRHSIMVSDIDNQSKNSFTTHQPSTPTNSQRPNISSNNSVNTANTNTPGNTSTTRRVIDFFKRRSIRL